MAAGANEAAIEAARRLFAQECRFVAGAAAAAQLPPPDLPEMAFAGRSNVGKSSLINALTGRNALARVAQAPGRTRQINFFRLADALMLVDLPGYGYAKASRREVENWTRLMIDYLRGRANLRRLCLLIDSRHGAKPADREIMALLDAAAVPYQAVLTKADKASAPALAQRRDELAAEFARHPAAHPDIIATSAHAGTGIAALRAELAGLAESGAVD